MKLVLYLVVIFFISEMLKKVCSYRIYSIISCVQASLFSPLSFSQKNLFTFLVFPYTQKRLRILHPKLFKRNIIFAESCVVFHLVHIPERSSMKPKKGLKEGRNLNQSCFFSTPFILSYCKVFGR